MARAYKPASPYSTPLILLKPTAGGALGVHTKSYPPVEDGELIKGSFKTFGGTEQNVDRVYSIIDTAVVETWYRPDITSNCRIVVVETNEVYEILGKPENIDMRNQYMQFKVQRVEGGA